MANGNNANFASRAHYIKELQLFFNFHEKAMLQRLIDDAAAGRLDFDGEIAGVAVLAQHHAVSMASALARLEQASRRRPEYRAAIVESVRHIRIEVDKVLHRG